MEEGARKPFSPIFYPPEGHSSLRAISLHSSTPSDLSFSFIHSVPPEGQAHGQSLASARPWPLRKITERTGQGDCRGKHQQHVIALLDPAWNGNGTGQGGGQWVLPGRAQGRPCTKERQEGPPGVENSKAKARFRRTVTGRLGRGLWDAVWDAGTWNLAVGRGPGRKGHASHLMVSKPQVQI